MLGVFIIIKRKMGTTVENKIPRTLKDPHILLGNWKLTYKITNRNGKAAFSGRNLTTYNDALTGMERPLYNLNGQPTNGFMIDRPVMTFNPGKDLNDRNKLDWLIGHPAVYVPQKHAKLSEDQIKNKDSNPRITLVNLDYEEVEDLDQADVIDTLIGKLSIVKGTQSISLQKIRFILSTLNKPYYDAKYLKNETVEKQKLKKHLKDFIRKGLNTDNADRVNIILNNLEEAKYGYQVKEMLRFGILNIYGGMYKIDSHPIGTTLESVIKYFIDNPDLYKELEGRLFSELASEIAKAQ
jgi:hypothetical protein